MGNRKTCHVTPWGMQPEASVCRIVCFCVTIHSLVTSRNGENMRCAWLNQTGTAFFFYSGPNACIVAIANKQESTRSLRLPASMVMKEVFIRCPKFQFMRTLQKLIVERALVQPRYWECMRAWFWELLNKNASTRRITEQWTKQFIRFGLELHIWLDEFRCYYLTGSGVIIWRSERNSVQ